MRNDLFARILDFLESKSRHYECEDGFYSCPMADGYFGTGAKKCDCGADEAQALLKEMIERPV